ncbi:ABC transporter substrate-binding protein [Streptobacillus moniliformis]|uniref:ABC transporter substrate-binding protein n=1 Tax=Streptobacillus moniliformis TaxID=34105 RepID=UPI0007E44972|nr:ABC transporter substrate-binding protein [Streptobacillus moniliformis]
MYKKFKILISVIFLGITVFSCGTKNSKDEVVTIKYWSFPNFNADSELKTPEEFDMALIKAFEEANPDIKVEYQKIDFTDGPAKLETSIISKSNPDVIIDAPGRVIDWAKKGYLVPFDIDTSIYSNTIVSAASHEGKLYLYPLGTAPFVMAFNKVITDKLGLTHMLPLDREGRNWTVEEFEALLMAIKEKDPSIDPIIFFNKTPDGSHGSRSFVLNLFDTWLTDKDITKYIVNNERGVKGLEWAKKAHDMGLLGDGASSEARDALEAFRSGLAAGTMIYSPGLNAISSNQQAKAEGRLDPVYVAMPNNGGQAKYELLLAGAAVFNNNDEAKIEASKKFVDFVINDPVWGQRALKATRNFSPIGKTGLYGDDEETKFIENINSNGNYGPYYNTIDGFAQMRPLWSNMVQAVLNGQISPKAGLNKFVIDATKAMEDAK